jgi:hypothetical protein
LLYQLVPSEWDTSEHGDRLQSQKRRVFKQKRGRWIMSRTVIAFGWQPTHFADLRLCNLAVSASSGWLPVPDEFLSYWLMVFFATLRIFVDLYHQIF